ncbi:hypothetical protein ACFL6Y_11425 [Elusimicrobiota bacterium]
MRYVITMENTGNRTFNNFQGKSSLRWAGDFSCTRHWYDNKAAAFARDSLLPGNADAGFHGMSMRKGGSASFEHIYPIPYEMCPGRGYVRVEGRHKNKSGRDEVASFTIPIGIRVERKK